MKAWGASALIFVALATCSRARADEQAPAVEIDDPDAAAAYQRAADLLYPVDDREPTTQAVTVACGLLEKSIDRQARMKSLYHLGVCYERLGRIASAYRTYKRATEYVLTDAEQALPDDRRERREGEMKVMREEAQRWVESHAPSQLTLTAAKDTAELPGLRLSIQLAGWPEPKPVALDGLDSYDGGHYTVVATADGYREWRMELDLAIEGQTETRAVGPLDRLAAATAKRAPSAFTPSRKLAAGLGVVGLGLGIAGIVMELQATDLCPDRQRCGDNTDAANRKERIAVGLGIGAGVAVIGAVVLWFAGGPERASETSVGVAPIVDGEHVGLVAAGTF